VNPNSDRRGEGVALAGGIVSLALFGLLLALGLYASSTALLATGLLAGTAAGIWALAYVQLHQLRLLDEERFEVAELERERQERLAGARTIFEESDLEQMDALSMGRRLRAVERWFVPIGGLAVAAVQIFCGLRLLPGPLAFALVKSDENSPIDRSAIGLATATIAGTAFITFLISRWALSLARLPQYHKVRSGGNVMFGVTMASLAVALGLGGVMAFDAPYIERWVAMGIGVLMLVLAIEMTLNFVLNFYRPRVAGVLDRSFFDSRILGMFSEPGGVLRSLADAVDYQFGFKVSETWFYQLLGRWIVPLLLVQAGVLWLMTAMVVVPVGHEAVIERFDFGGSSVSVVTPGVTFTWPWPINRATQIPTERIQRVEVGYQRTDEDEARSRDPSEPQLWTVQHRKNEYALLVPDRTAAADESLPLNLLSLTAPIQWRVKPGHTLEYHRMARDVPELVESMAYRVLTRFAGKADILDLLSSGGAAAAETVRAALQEELDRAGPEGGDLGVEVVQVSLASIHPITVSAEAYEDVVASYQRKESKILRARGEADRSEIEAGGLKHAALYDAIIREEKALAAQPAASRTSQGADAIEETQEVNRMLLEESGGLAQAIVSSAQQFAQQRVQSEAAGADLYKIQLQLYRQAPQSFMQRSWLERLERALEGSRKYILTLKDNNRVTVEFIETPPLANDLIQTTIQGLKKGD